MTDGDVKVFTYFSDSTSGLEDRVQDLIDRGGRVISLAIGYGPSPARVQGSAYADEASWHAMVVLDVSGIDPSL